MISHVHQHREGHWFAWAESGAIGAYAVGPNRNAAVFAAFAIVDFTEGAFDASALPSKVRAGSDVVSGRALGCAYRTGGIR